MEKTFLKNPSEKSNGMLTADKRAEVLTIIDKTLKEKNINLEVAGYEDNDYVFDILLTRRDR